MKITMTTWVKIGAFVLIGVLFGCVMTLYSNSRVVGSGGKLSGVFEEMFNSSEKADRVIEKSFSVKKGGTLTLTTECGDVDIVSGSADAVQVKVDISGSDRRMEKFTVDMKQDGDDVTIDGRSGEEGFLRWQTGSFSVHYRIIVPEKYSVNGSTAGGDLRFRLLDGTIKFQTSGGNVAVDSSRGMFDLSTSGGDVKVNGLKGETKVQTSGGNIHCDNIDGDLDAETSGGDIKLKNIIGKLHGETSGGNVYARLPGENKGVDLHTSGGNITIEIPAQAKATIEASTSGGRVKCDLPITLQGEIDGSSLEGAVNGGGPMIKAETSGGDIKIIKIK
ncbi:MAG: DUF4097 family beta strand repeat-containing protein [Ignavibacteriales bacterium]|nr:DUF4097 family beta strand repeat-containing protein [Ignavibacteriales bacterium]